MGGKRHTADSGRLRHRGGRGGKFRLRAIRLLRPEQGLCGGDKERKQHAGDGAAGEGAAEQAELDERERDEQGLHQPDLQQLQQPFRGKQELPEYTGMTKDELFGGYNEMAESLAEQRKALLSAALAQNRTEQEKANSNYDELARQAYILKRQNENALPQQLAALGISGGGSESANLSLAANYENNLASNEQARQQALRDYALQALQARTQADATSAAIMRTQNSRR